VCSFRRFIAENVSQSLSKMNGHVAELDRESSEVLRKWRGVLEAGSWRVLTTRKADKKDSGFIEPIEPFE
jgi:hypothetical protein